MLLFMDGASHYDTAQLGQKWTALTSTAVTWAVVNEGRVAGCIRRTSTSNTSIAGALTFTPLFTQTGTWTPTNTGVFGCALKVDTLGFLTGGSPGIPGLGVLSDGFFTVTTALGDVLSWMLQPNGTINVYCARGISFGGPRLLGTTLEALNDGEWSYLEFKWGLSLNDDGFVIVKANGTTVLTFMGRTLPTAGEYFPFTPPTGPWVSIRALGSQSTPAPDLLLMRMCDTVLLDLNTPNGDFLGDVNIAYIKPDGEGDYANWTPSPSPPNWACVDEVPPNDDTDYVVASAPGTKDVYHFEDVLGNPLAIQVCTYARKEDPSGASVAVTTRQGSTDFTGPTQGVGSTSYDYLLQPYDTNPATGVQWTKPQMDAGQWGPDKIS